MLPWRWQCQKWFQPEGCRLLRLTNLWPALSTLPPTHQTLKKNNIFFIYHHFIFLLLQLVWGISGLLKENSWLLSELSMVKINMFSLMFLKSGLSTDGDTDRVLLVGPTAPATYRLHPGETGNKPIRAATLVSDCEWSWRRCEDLLVTCLFDEVVRSSPGQLCWHSVQTIGLTHKHTLWGNSLDMMMTMMMIMMKMLLCDIIIKYDSVTLLCAAVHNLPERWPCCWRCWSRWCQHQPAGTPVHTETGKMTQI